MISKGQKIKTSSLLPQPNIGMKLELNSLPNPHPMSTLLLYEGKGIQLALGKLPQANIWIFFCLIGNELCAFLIDEWWTNKYVYTISPYSSFSLLLAVECWPNVGHSALSIFLNKGQFN